MHIFLTVTRETSRSNFVFKYNIFIFDALLTGHTDVVQDTRQRRVRVSKHGINIYKREQIMNVNTVLTRNGGGTVREQNLDSNRPLGVTYYFIIIAI